MTLSSAARMGLTFYLIRALYSYWTGDEVSANGWAEKGVLMLRQLQAGAERLH